MSKAPSEYATLHGSSSALPQRYDTFASDSATRKQQTKTSWNTYHRATLYACIVILAACVVVFFLALYTPNENLHTKDLQTKDSNAHTVTNLQKSDLPRPNIVFILADDLGMGDVGYMSSQMHTPNIDALADESIVLTQYYTSTVCSPTRATLLTGRYPLHHGVLSLLAPTYPMGLPLRETTLADVLTDNGYDTHAIGKWHLGFYKWDYTPTFRGFSTFYGFYNGGTNYFTHLRDGMFDFRDDTGLNCGADCSRLAFEVKDQYSTKLFTERAIEILSDYSPHASNPKKDPFFLYLSHQAVHSPHHASEQHLHIYEDIDDLERREYASVVSAMDQSVGEVMQALRNLNLLENSIVVFSSDNGAGTGGAPDGVGGSNWPLKGGKHSLWEGGVRVPGMIRLPKHMRKYLENFSPQQIEEEKKGIDCLVPNTHGMLFNHLFNAADWMPTLLEAVGVDYTSLGIEFDGVSQWKALTGGVSPNEEAPRTSMWYGHDFTLPYTWAGQHTAHRMGDYKLIDYSGSDPDGWYPPPCMPQSEDGKCGLFVKDIPTPMYASETGMKLYDLRKDPLEQYDISHELPHIVKEMYTEMTKIKKSAESAMQWDYSCGYGPEEGSPFKTMRVYSDEIRVWEPFCY